MNSRQLARRGRRRVSSSGRGFAGIPAGERRPSRSHPAPPQARGQDDHDARAAAQTTKRPLKPPIRANDDLHRYREPRKTLEWALATAGNKDVMLDALEQVKPRVAARVREELANTDPTNPFDTALIGDKMLGAIADVKGRYAQDLAELIADPEVKFEVPQYLVDAIEWVADEVDEWPK